MKANVLNVDGKKLHDVDLPNCFNADVREDMIRKVFEASRTRQPSSPNIVAGMQHSASGKLRHARRKWKTTYGYGISRVPRKIHTRRGRRFFWVGATISSVRGGRQSHPPKILALLQGKINKKERAKALFAAIAATASLASLKKRYARLADTEGKKIQIGLPLVFDSKITGLGTKELRKLINDVLGLLSEIAGKEKKQRAGRGKARGRKYKQSRGLLIVTASDEKLKCRYFDTSHAKELNLKELAPGGVPGRLVMYTEKAISELRDRFGGKKD